MDIATSNLVRDRAADRCEYCQLPQDAVNATFHVDHIIAQQHLDDSNDDPSQLALACDRCNLYKGTNLSSIDPLNQQRADLFDPRRDSWNEHFRWNGPVVSGLTPIGRATVRLLRMNAKQRIELRQWLFDEGFM